MLAIGCAYATSASGAHLPSRIRRRGELPPGGSDQRSAHTFAEILAVKRACKCRRVRQSRRQGPIPAAVFHGIVGTGPHLRSGLGSRHATSAPRRGSRVTLQHRSLQTPAQAPGPRGVAAHGPMRKNGAAHLPRTVRSIPPIPRGEGVRAGACKTPCGAMRAKAAVPRSK